MPSKTPLLPGFRRLEGRAGVMVVRDGYQARLEALGLFRPGLPGVGPNGHALDGAGRGRNLVVPLGAGEGERVLVRPYRHGGLFRWLLRSLFLDRERPVRELSLMASLAAWGVPTLTCLAAVARRVAPGVWRHFLVTRYEEDARDLLAFLQGEGHPVRRRRVLEEAGRVVRLMHRQGVDHADLHPRNILVAPGAPPRVLIIDLDQSRVRAALSRSARVRVLARLERFLHKLREREGLELGRGDRMRFLRGYYGRLGREAREELRLVARRLALLLPWHRVVWVVEALLTGRGQALRRHLSQGR